MEMELAKLREWWACKPMITITRKFPVASRVGQTSDDSCQMISERQETAARKRKEWGEKCIAMGFSVLTKEELWPVDEPPDAEGDQCPKQFGERAVAEETTCKSPREVDVAEETTHNSLKKVAVAEESTCKPSREVAVAEESTCMTP